MIRRLFRLLFLSAFVIGALATGAQTTPPKPGKKPLRVFLRVERTRLLLGNLPYRNVGANLPDLFERFLHGDDAGAIQSLATAKAAGIRFARCFGATWGPQDFGIFEQDQTRWLAAYDRMLAAADAAGIALVPSLLFHIAMLPEYVRQTTGKDEQVVNFLTPGSASNDLAVTYVTTIVSRYRNDPRILFWEIGNEYNLEADLSSEWKKRPVNQIPTSDQIQAFFVQIAGLIKRLDKNHLVTSGNADMRPSAWHLRQAMLSYKNKPNPTDFPMDWTKDTFEEYVKALRAFNPPPLDIISVHQYPPGKDMARWLFPDDTKALLLPWARTAGDLIGKPLFVGEFGEQLFLNGKEQNAAWTVDFLGRMAAEAAPLAAIWSWEYDPNNPSQSPYSLSAQRTPKTIRTLAQTNQLILRAILGTTPPISKP